MSCLKVTEDEITRSIEVGSSGKGKAAEYRVLPASLFQTLNHSLYVRADTLSGFAFAVG
jgi:hypothetical protein